ncbi:MAG: hypothetical protein R2734_14595 [Nocardioides sp.]
MSTSTITSSGSRRGAPSATSSTAPALPDLEALLDARADTRTPAAAAQTNAVAAFTAELVARPGVSRRAAAAGRHRCSGSPRTVQRTQAW